MSETYESNYDIIAAASNKKGLFNAKYGKPTWFDEKLFNDGREFYFTHKFGCQMSMLVSLVMGLSFEKLLEVLVFTEKSDTGKKAFWRYFQTMLHTQSWFKTDIFDTSSEGYKSINKIRKIHSSVALRITKDRGDPVDGKWVSQTDLAYTLIGFAGSILIAPVDFGCHDTSQLPGYIHYWRVLGYLHGIDDAYNPFGGSMERAQNTIADVTGNCLIPSLETPPKDFPKMVQAVCDWAGPQNGIIGYGISIIISNNQYLQRPMNEERLEVLKNLYPVKTMRERLKFNNYYYMFHYLYRWAFIRAFLNYSFEFGVYMMQKKMALGNCLSRYFRKSTPMKML